MNCRMNVALSGNPVAPAYRLRAGNAISTNPRPQDFGNDNRAVGLLIVFEDGHHRPRNGNGGAIQGMHHAQSLFGPAFASGYSTTAHLKVRAIRSAGDFSIFARRLAILDLAAAGHPGFEVVFDDRPVRPNRRCRYRARGTATPALKDPLLDPQDFLMNGFALLRRQKTNISTLVNWWTR